MVVSRAFGQSLDPIDNLIPTYGADLVPGYSEPVPVMSGIDMLRLHLVLLIGKPQKKCCFFMVVPLKPQPPSHELNGRRKKSNFFLNGTAFTHPP